MLEVEYYWKFRKHYRAAIPGRERIAFVVQAVSFWCAFLLAVAIFIAAIWADSIPLGCGLGALLFLCMTVHLIAYAVENWYYEPKKSARCAVLSVLSLFFAILLLLPVLIRGPLV